MIKVTWIQNFTDVIIDQLESGDTYVKKNQQIIKNNKIKLLCKNYNSNKTLDFIDNIVSNLKWFIIIDDDYYLELLLFKETINWELLFENYYLNKLLFRQIIVWFFY